MARFLLLVVVFRCFSSVHYLVSPFCKVEFPLGFAGNSGYRVTAFSERADLNRMESNCSNGREAKRPTSNTTRRYADRAHGFFRYEFLKVKLSCFTFRNSYLGSSRPLLVGWRRIARSALKTETFGRREKWSPGPTFRTVLAPVNVHAQVNSTGLIISTWTRKRDR